MAKGYRVAEGAGEAAETATQVDAQPWSTRSDARAALGADSVELDSEQLPNGSVVCGKFRVLGAQRAAGEELAFKALHLSTGRRVELRVLPQGVRPDGPEAERMLRAARAAGRAPHSNVLNVVDSGLDAEQRPFVVYEQFAGVPCHELIARRGPCAARIAADIVAQVLDGLSALHARGIYHRQVRPENVLIDGSSEELRVKLVGLGYSAHEGKDAEAPELPKGALRFLAPEARRGDVVAGASVDIYAAGVLLRYLLTGESARTYELEPAVERVLTCALADDVEERYQTAEQFRGAVSALIGPTQRESLLPSGSLEADLRFLLRRRDAQERERAQIATRVTPVDQGRFELYPVLLIIESLYARMGAFGWSLLTTELPTVEELLPAAGHGELLAQRGVSAALITEMLRHADAAVGRGNLRMLIELGEELARRGLGRFCSALPAQLTPESLVACVPALWRSLLRDGEVTLGEDAHGSARITIRSQLGASVEISALFASLLRGQLRVLSPEGEVNLIASQALGDSADVYQLTW
ncbi:MAG TPA: protein kinase [Polyangiales bacterium]